MKPERNWQPNDYGTHTARLMSAEICRGKINGTKQVNVIYQTEPGGMEFPAFYCLEDHVPDWHLRAFLERLGYCGSGLDMRYLPDLLEHISADQPICQIRARSDAVLITAELLKRLSPPPEPPN